MAAETSNFHRSLLARKDGKKLFLYTVTCKVCRWKVVGLPWALSAAERAHVCPTHRVLAKAA